MRNRPYLSGAQVLKPTRARYSFHPRFDTEQDALLPSRVARPSRSFLPFCLAARSANQAPFAPPRAACYRGPKYTQMMLSKMRSVFRMARSAGAQRHAAGVRRRPAGGSCAAATLTLRQACRAQRPAPQAPGGSPADASRLLSAAPVRSATPLGVRRRPGRRRLLLRRHTRAERRVVPGPPARLQRACYHQQRRKI